jgi:hypothetical protein
VDERKGFELPALLARLVAVEAIQTQGCTLGSRFGGGDAGGRSFRDGQGERRLVELERPGTLRCDGGGPPERVQGERRALAEAHEQEPGRDQILRGVDESCLALITREIPVREDGIRGSGQLLRGALALVEADCQHRRRHLPKHATRGVDPNQTRSLLR